MSIAEKIRNARIAAGFTQMELAEKIGVSWRQLQHWESGRRNPKLETIKKIAYALGVDYKDWI